MVRREERSRTSVNSNSICAMHLPVCGVGGRVVVVWLSWRAAEIDALSARVSRCQDRLQRGEQL